MEWNEKIEIILSLTKLSPSELGRSGGVGYRYIADILSGKSNNPKTEFIKKITETLGLNPSWVILGEGPVFQPGSKWETVSHLKYDSEGEDGKIKLDTVSNFTAPGSEKSATVAYLPGAGHKNEPGSYLKDTKSNTVLHLTWKDRMARIYEIVGLHEPQDLPFCFGYKDHGLIWGLINGKTPAPTDVELKEIIKVFGLNEEWIRTGQEPVFRNGFNYHRLAEKYKLEHPQAKDGPAATLGGPLDQDDLQALPFQGAEALQDPGAFLIPLIDQPVSAGGGTELNGHDDVHSFIPVPKALRRYGKRLAAVPVRGDSMEPTIYHDDMVVCDTCGWEGDGIYVLRMRDGAYVKRLAVRPQGLRVISDNKAYDAYDVNPEADGVAVVGRVRCILRVVR